MVHGPGALAGVAMRREFWRGKRVLLTGHTGFKGGWLALWLQHAGAEVAGYALAPPTEPSLFEVARVGWGMEAVEGDVRDAAGLKAALLRQRPQIVFHLAAQALVRTSYEDPVATYATNVMGTVNLLEAVRRVAGVRAVVLVTSDKCYENREWAWGYREVDRLGGRDPYSSSKACAELAAAAYRESYFPGARFAEHGVAVATVRAGNVVGGGDWAADRLVPDAMRAFLAGRPLVVRHAGAVRPWQHVLEPLHGYLMLAERLAEGGADGAGAWNFGPAEKDTQPVGAVVERLVAHWGESAGCTLAPSGPTGPPEAGSLRLDSSLARARLGWAPVWNLDEGLEATVAWYRAYQQGQDLRRFSLMQIEAYQQKAEAGKPELGLPQRAGRG